MRRVLSRVAMAAILVSGVLPGCAEVPPGGRIPEVHSTSLTGQRVDLPAMLQGKTGVLVLGFSRDSRAQVTAWGKRLAADYRESPDVMYYEMPVLASVPRVLRGMVLRSIRSEVSERAQSHFAPILGDEPRWRSAAQYSRPDDAYVLVVDGKGAVRARVAGAAEDAAYATVKQEVGALRRAEGQ